MDGILWPILTEHCHDFCAWPALSFIPLHSNKLQAAFDLISFRAGHLHYLSNLQAERQFKVRLMINHLSLIPKRSLHWCLHLLHNSKQLHETSSVCLPQRTEQSFFLIGLFVNLLFVVFAWRGEATHSEWMKRERACSRWTVSATTLRLGRY